MIRAGAGLSAALTVFVLATGLLSPARAWADDEDAARAHLKRGNELFNDGKYREAAKEYETGYEAAPKPGFLVNIAQCYRRIGDLPRARRYIKTYLSLETNDARREKAEALLKDVENEIAAATAEAGPEPSPPVAEAEKPEAQAPAETPAQEEEPPAPLPSARPEATDTRSAALVEKTGEDRTEGAPVYERWWFWATLSAVVVGGAAAAYLATRSKGGASWTPCGSLGCKDEPK